MDIDERDVNLGITKNYCIRTRVIDSSGAGVNAESRWGDLALGAGDPLSELVYLPHNGGLSVKCASSRPEEQKPFLMWNVGPSTKVWGIPDETTVGADDVFVDRAALLAPLETRRQTTESGLKLVSPDESSGKMKKAADKHTADLQPQKVPDDEATSPAGVLYKNETNIPISILAPPVEGSETKSKICVYKEKGKEIALSDEDDVHESIKSCTNSVGLLSRGVKRWSHVNDVMDGSKRIRNQIPLCSGSTSIPRPDGSLMKWISKVVKDFSDSNRQDSSSFPLPLACSIGVNARNPQDSGSPDMGFQLIVDNKKTLDDFCLSRQIIVCDNQARNDLLIPAVSEKASVEKRKLSGSLWVTRLCTKSPTLEKCQETVGCSTSCPKLDLDSGINVVFPVDQRSWESRDDFQVNQKCSSTNTEVSVDLKSTSKVCSIQKVGSSEAMTPVFAKRVGAIRHFMPLENDDNQKVPRYDVVSARNTVAMSEIFRAIQNLRLSRADILRWMNSDVSLSRLNGFFLRLRLRKMDQGLEGTSYYVACISAGDDRESTGSTTSKTILVDVGGIKSCITSQYVSNHDFLEDEIKAWWCGAVDRGCGVPSIDELNSRFNNRTSLGF